MKKFTQLFVVMLAPFISGTGFASETAKITLMHIDPTAFGRIQFTRGYLVKDGETHEVALVLESNDPAEKFQTTLPIILIVANPTGGETIVGQKDGRPYDGILERLTLRTKMGKPFENRQGAVTARYDTEVENRQGHYKTHSFFTATGFAGSAP